MSWQLTSLCDWLLGIAAAQHGHLLHQANAPFVTIRHPAVPSLFQEAAQL